MNFLYLPREATGTGSGREGIRIRWIKRRKVINIDGWYDSWVGIRGDRMTLREFFDALGITQRDCEMAWKEGE